VREAAAAAAASKDDFSISESICWRGENEIERAKRERAVFLIRKRHPPPADGVHSIFSRHASVSGESESACFLN